MKLYIRAGTTGATGCNSLVAQARCLQLIPINAHATGDNAQSIASNGGQKEDEIVTALTTASHMHSCTIMQEDFEPQGPSEFREVTEVVVKDTKRLHRMGILTGKTSIPKRRT